MKVRQIWKSYKPWNATTSFPKHWEYNYGQYLVGAWGHLWCPPTLALPFGTPQNDKLRYFNYVILTKSKSKSKWRPWNSVSRLPLHPHIPTEVISIQANVCMMSYHQ